MEKNFNAKNWKDYLPQPVCEEFPEYQEFYKKAWELARSHVKSIEGMPQNPYIDEAFCDTQVWIWDTCFMSLFCKFAQEVFPGKETFRNFYDVLYNGKILPEVIPTKDEPWWTGAVPGKPMNIQVHIADNPPLFAWAEYENALIHGDKEYLYDLLYVKKDLQKHYEWIEGLKEQALLPGVLNPTCLINQGIGYQWEGGCSGMDNTPRGKLGDREEKERPNNPNMLWLDAICQQALSAKAIAKMFALFEDHNKENEWLEIFEEKRDIINRYYWDKEDKFYYDIDLSDKHFYKVRTIASYWTLTSEIASKEQAEKMLSYLFDDTDFSGKMPFLSLSKKDADYQGKGKYWRGSVWLPTAYATLKGLANYGYFEQAHNLAKKLFLGMLKTYQDYEPHTIWECYAPEFFEPATQVDNEEIVRPDFCGWSALGPISIYVEYVLGFHTINAFEKVVEWAKPNDYKGKIGIKNLRFGGIVTDIIADEKICMVESNEGYTLKINGYNYTVNEGENKFVFGE